MDWKRAVGGMLSGYAGGKLKDIDRQEQMQGQVDLARIKMQLEAEAEQAAETRRAAREGVERDRVGGLLRDAMGGSREADAVKGEVALETGEIVDMTGRSVGKAGAERTPEEVYRALATKDLDLANKYATGQKNMQSFDRDNKKPVPSYGGAYVWNDELGEYEFESAVRKSESVSTTNGGGKSSGSKGRWVVVGEKASKGMINGPDGKPLGGGSKRKVWRNTETGEEITLGSGTDPNKSAATNQAPTGKAPAQRTISQADLEYTAKKHGLTVEQVKQKLGIK